MMQCLSTKTPVQHPCIASPTLFLCDCSSISNSANDWIKKRTVCGDSKWPSAWSVSLVRVCLQNCARENTPEYVRAGVCGKERTRIVESCCRGRAAESWYGWRREGGDERVGRAREREGERHWGLERWVSVCVRFGDANYPSEIHYVTVSVAAARQNAVAVKGITPHSTSQSHTSVSELPPVLLMSRSIWAAKCNWWGIRRHQGHRWKQ